jgi:hypothetical protein
MTALFWSWPASEPAKTRMLTAAVAPRIVEAGIALGRLRLWHSPARWRDNRGGKRTPVQQGPLKSFFLLAANPLVRCIYSISSTT